MGSPRVVGDPASQPELSGWVRFHVSLAPTADSSASTGKRQNYALDYRDPGSFRGFDRRHLGRACDGLGEVEGFSRRVEVRSLKATSSLSLGSAIDFLALLSYMEGHI
jgi:hypothetical protein